MKTLEFIYQETEIHFLVNPHNKNVMVNATEMAQLFNRKTEKFLRTDTTKEFIKVLERHPKGVRSEEKITDNRGHMGIYFSRILALKFAAWLNPEFEVWIFSTMDEIIFGNYKKHWDAHAQQEAARVLMEKLKEELLDHGSPELAKEYFNAERLFSIAKNDKSNAIRNQIKLFNS